MAHMCPQCGWLFDLGSRSLIPTHHIGAGAECAGSEQKPRNPDADRRPLWSGKPNPWLDDHLFTADPEGGA